LPDFLVLIFFHRIKTTEGIKMNTAQISQKIIFQLNTNGGDLAKAIDAVIGHGAYAKLVGDVYDELNNSFDKRVQDLQLCNLSRREAEAQARTEFNRV